jgi:His/Glu/Gln/Arg/opine family amino acid ABC transporter permease subunit
MQYIPRLMQGLWVTLFISFISLFISAIPGSLLFLAKVCKIKIIYIISTAYIEFFEGIPVIAQLLFVFYALPLISPSLYFTPIVTAIIVLSLNAIANIANTAKEHLERSIVSPGAFIYLKVLTLSITEVSRRIIGYSALLSIIAVTDLLRVSHTIMNTTYKVTALVIAILLYLLMSIIIKIIYKVLKKSFSMGSNEFKI